MRILRLFILLVSFVMGFSRVIAQKKTLIHSFTVYDDVGITIDQSLIGNSVKQTIIIFYALPNGNSTMQTMGKIMQPTDDWHYDIQHIRAQTGFIRHELKNKNIIVVYLENEYKSWPAWKQKHPDFKVLIPRMIDSISNAMPGNNKSIYLNGHSGGGSLIFGYLAGVEQIPQNIKRISFIDSNYGYDSTYYPKLKQWLKNDKQATLTLFAYNDSVALYNGKPVVSATGGTWHRGHLLLNELQKDFEISLKRDDSLVVYKSSDNRIQFFFKKNPDQKIYHTQQVELNGFIHSILAGTKLDSRKYRYYSERAYGKFIE